MVQQRDDVVLIDAAILGPPQVWEASGHLANFTDPLVDCTNCKQRFRLDKLDDPDTCPNCGKHGVHRGAPVQPDVQDPRRPVEDVGAVVYLRPETAQGMFVNFANVLQTSRKKPPFGIAQVGKSFRNEITPQNWIFRTREFEQMEMEFFVPPAEAPQWYEYWCDERLDWYVRLGIPPTCCACARTTPTSCRTTRRGRPTSSSSSRGAGTSWRASPSAPTTTSRQHAAALGRAPRLLRPGHERALRAVRRRAGGRRDAHDGGVPARRLRRGRGQRRGPHRAAPAPAHRAVQGGRAAAVEEGHAPPLAHEVRSMLSERYMVDYDETQAIGRRYRRQDEIGTPLVRHRRLRLARGQGRDDPRPRHHRAGAGADRRAGRRGRRAPRLLTSGPPAARSHHE